MGKQSGLAADGYMDEALNAFDKAIGDMGIGLPEAGRVLVEEWLRFFVGWEGRRVAGFENPGQLAVKLLADSFAVGFVEGLCTGGNAVDLGSGNGWPGLALSALGKCARVRLLDSRQGACDFLRSFIRRSGMPGVDVVQERAENAGQGRELREGFSLAVSRAMAMPGIALELCSGLLAVGGKAVLWIGPEQQAPRAEPGLAQTGMRLEEEIPYSLPEDMGRRVLAVYAKTEALDSRYPRRYAAIRKKPLI